MTGREPRRSVIGLALGLLIAGIAAIWLVMVPGYDDGALSTQGSGPDSAQAEAARTRDAAVGAQEVEETAPSTATVDDSRLSEARHAVRLRFVDPEGEPLAMRAVSTAADAEPRARLAPEADGSWTGALAAGRHRGFATGPGARAVHRFPLEVTGPTDRVVVLTSVRSRVALLVVDDEGREVRGSLELRLFDFGDRPDADRMRGWERMRSVIFAGWPMRDPRVVRGEGPEILVDVPVGSSAFVTVASDHASGSRWIHADDDDVAVVVVLRAKPEGRPFRVSTPADPGLAAGKTIRLTSWRDATVPSWQAVLSDEGLATVPDYEPWHVLNYLVLRDPTRKGLPIGIASLPDAEDPAWKPSALPLEVVVADTEVETWTATGVDPSEGARLELHLSDRGRPVVPLGHVPLTEAMELPRWILRDDLVASVVDAEGQRRMAMLDGAARTITLEAARVVSGRVVDDEGRPLEGARVRLWQEPWSRAGESPFIATTSAEGRYRLVVPRVAAGELLAELDGFAPRASPLPEQDDVVDFVLEPMPFTVLTIEGEGPCRGLSGEITIAPDGGRDARRRFVVKDGEASIPLSHGKGRYDLAFRFASAALHLGLSADLDAPTDVVVLPRLVRVSATVTAAGTPLPRHAIAFSWWQPGFQEVKSASYVEDGAFSALMPEDGSKLIHVRVCTLSSIGLFGAGQDASLLLDRSMTVDEIRRGIDVGGLEVHALNLRGSATDRTVNLRWDRGSRRVPVAAGSDVTVTLPPGVDQLVAHAPDALPISLTLPATLDLARFDVLRDVRLDPRIVAIKGSELEIETSGALPVRVGRRVRGGELTASHHLSVRPRDGEAFPAELVPDGDGWLVTFDASDD